MGNKSHYFVRSKTAVWNGERILLRRDLGVVAQICDRVAVLYAGRVVETAATEVIFSDPHHPYTQGLLKAVPKPGSKGSALTAIPGNVPANPGAITGCGFASRCAHVMDRCRQERPLLVDVKPQHQSACFLVENEGAGEL